MKMLRCSRKLCQILPSTRGITHLAKNDGFLRGMYVLIYRMQFGFSLHQPGVLWTLSLREGPSVRQCQCVARQGVTVACVGLIYNRPTYHMTGILPSWVTIIVSPGMPFIYL